MKDIAMAMRWRCLRWSRFEDASRRACSLQAFDAERKQRPQ